MSDARKCVHKRDPKILRTPKRDPSVRLFSKAKGRRTPPASSIILVAFSSLLGLCALVILPRMFPSSVNGWLIAPYMRLPDCLQQTSKTVSSYIETVITNWTKETGWPHYRWSTTPLITAFVLQECVSAIPSSCDVVNFHLCLSPHARMVLWELLQTIA